MGDVRVGQLSQLGIAKATVFGTPVADGGFSKGMLVSAFTANPATTVERIPEVRGDFSTRRVTKGPIDLEISLEMPLDVGDNTSGGIGELLTALLGSDVITGAGDPFTHTFQLNASAFPTLHDFWTDKGDNVAKQIVSVRITELKVTVDGSEGMISVEASGIAKKQMDNAVETLVFSAEPIMVPSDVTSLVIAGAAANDWETIEITLTNEIEGIHPVGAEREINNSYRKEFKGEIVISGLVFSNDGLRTRFLDGTDSSFQLIMLQGGNASRSLKFFFPECAVTNWEGPEIADTDIPRATATLLVKGDPTAWYVELKNNRSTQYD